ncbi:phospholipase D-like protein [Novosphingobium sp. PhB165]|uniref:SHOCT domain-containing protein n=1 Tax=Novosphingobium sp. PhB165 TaxID=2485105 RepID=UPI0010462FE6|nr:SHOCT domain-containing protein [Novosphingobium sp. PhB165]TCM18168.1 phospholipase D-like protein [Novosphingobium sp. PhB165]
MDLPGFWTFLLDVAVIFVFVMWFWLLITVLRDLFRRDDAGGFKKILWVILLIVAPFLGVFLYLLLQSKGMAIRNGQEVARTREQLREFIGQSPAQELEKLEALKASGAITSEEHAKLRARVIG